MSQGISFSVVMPVFNNRATVVRALESGLAQTLPPLELIVVDDGSTDGTADLVRAAFGPQVRLIGLPRNGGPSVARNAGLEAARGTHIAFLDGDDWWLPQKLSRMADLIKEYPEAHLFFHDHALDTGQPIPSTQPRLFPLRHFLWRSPVATPCAVVRRSRLRFEERFRWMEDYDFFLRTAEAGKVIYLPGPLTILGRPVLSEGGQSSRRWQMRKGEWQVLKAFAVRHPWALLLLPFWAGWLLFKHLSQEAGRRL